MRICNDCGHVFETSSFKCEKCDSLNIERVNPNDKIKEEDWIKLLSPSKETKRKIAYAILVVVILIIVLSFNSTPLVRFAGHILGLFIKH